MNNNLIIFIDSLPFYYLCKIPNMSKYLQQYKVIPGLGYSINIHAELFGGYSPDDVGFFNEWTYDPENAPLRKLKFAETLLRRINRRNFCYRAIKKIICTSFNIKAFDVRPDYLCRFARKGEEIYSVKRSIAGKKGLYDFSFSMPTIFNTSNNLITVMTDSSAERLGGRDYSVYFQAKELVKESRNLFLWFPDLDGIAHVYGVGSETYHQHIMNLDKWIEELKMMFLANNNDGNVIIFSDHGMVNVKQIVRLQLEANIDKPGDSTYHYFTDSTIIRVWLLDGKLNSNITEYLNSLNVGTVLDEDYREAKGVASKEFGDIIFILNDGNIFDQTSLSRDAGRAKAMHGYLPEVESQKGIALFSLGSELFQNSEIKTFDLYNYIKKLV